MSTPIVRKLKPEPVTPSLATNSPEPETVFGADTPYRFRDRPLTISRGYPLPLGAGRAADGVNFALICMRGTAVTLVLSEPCGAEIQAEIPLDPVLCRTGHHWHVRVGGLPEEFCYGYRVDGPNSIGDCYDPRNILLDPASRALSCGRPWGYRGEVPRRSLMTASMAEKPDIDDPRHAASPPRGHDPLRVARPRLHGRSLVGRSSRRHLRRVGREDRPSEGPGDHRRRADADRRVRRDRLPVRQPADRRAEPELLGLQHDRLRRAEGRLRGQPGGRRPWEEFRRMVRAFHAQGLEVVLDVVFNHTAEGGEGGRRTTSGAWTTACTTCSTTTAAT